ncbi:S9 family peptidase [Pseudorhodoplanes sinuspersici]|uniref:S9 family peptidase n=1 Tax=Pseudorhodoplanes sinuspersici TaxID=1235591 RepID=A0A1W6ZXQ5_9HYPH|nr:S9 family peptidase [Pseudorhodoplanes sinuspersici]ARQ02110.1 S9 family peptidase [Pseudorhodoplanes sinuspersici]RKE73909.1 oligopeptidase B [Pseudorhodoplanes sinuspersici]
MSKAPIAKRVPHSFTRHGVTIADPYAWLRDPSYPNVTEADVLDYLKAENAYFEAEMKPHQDLIDTIFAEMKGRIKDDESSVPQKDGDYVYWSAFDAGGQYPKWYRRLAKGGPDIVILDEPEMAKDHEFFRLGGHAVSPDGRLLAYAVDTNGSERYVLKVRDLDTGMDLPDVIENWRYGLVWAADSKSFLYTDADENWRSKTVWHHKLGEMQSADRIVYQESELEFSVSVGLTQSRAFAAISTGDSDTNEVRLIPTSDFTAEPVLISPRKPDRLYDVDEREGTLYIRVNDTHVNFRIVTAPVSAPGTWTELIAGDEHHYLLSLTSFENLLVIEERIDGLSQIRLRDYADGKDRYISFKEASYVAGLGNNPEYKVDRLRLSYQSMVTPSTVYDYHLADARLETLKVREIPSGYDASQYVTERLMAPARDGVMVPISIVYRKDFKKDGSGFLHIYAYGAYGFAYPPNFSANRLSLLDRGFACAIAHIRGGDDLGYRWYLDGKLDKRTNTFNDFVDVTRFLIDQGYAKAGHVTAAGGSAGGELMGAIVNQAPSLYGAVAAHVPFVDVLNTMLDDTLPLTPGEWSQWGNPITDKKAFDYIRSYSPYDNVTAQDYPALLITGGLNDPRVTYWEPAKWAAKLRATKTDNNTLLMKINMGAGHGGKSGRYTSLQESAEEYAFMLTQMGAVQPTIAPVSLT